jgi:pimeloyl-ACP methyl ester carboxylesterase
MGERLGARTVLVPDAAHYAQHQAPDAVLTAATELLAGLTRNGACWSVTGA